MFFKIYKQFINICFINMFVAVVFMPAMDVQAQAVRSADEVMQLHVARDDKDDLQLQWNIAPNVYIYRDKISVEKVDGTLLPVDVAEGVAKEDINWGNTEVLYNRGFAQIAKDTLPEVGHVLIRWQGCEEDSICYPPITKSLDLQTLKISKTELGFDGQIQSKSPATEKSAVIQSDLSTNVPQQMTDTTHVNSSDENDGIALFATDFSVMLFVFFGFGLLLSFTPCVFPMIPILSGMLARSGDKLSAGRGFVLSSAYVVAMAAAYAALGFAASWSGYNLQAALQTPYVLGFMALIFVMLAFSMFGYYELQLPAKWTRYFSRRTSGNKGGAITGAFLLGFGSALIVGPCVTPPLAAGLLYVAQTGDALRGASALFALGLGMGVPLIVFGTFGARFLPKSGAWLNYIKQFFGVVFLGLAIYMILRLLSGEIAMLVLAITALTCAVFLGVFERLAHECGPLKRIEKIIAVVALIYGTLLMIGFAGGSTDPWQPLNFLQSNTAKLSQNIGLQTVKTVKTVEEYDAALNSLSASGKPVMVDFTADWCAICKINDRVLQKPEIADRLSHLAVIKADITEYNDQSRALMQRFNIVGPPTVFFVEGQGVEMQRAKRIVGAITVEKIDERLSALGL